jgi:hypothetical protein
MRTGWRRGACEIELTFVPLSISAGGTRPSLMEQVVSAVESSAGSTDRRRKETNAILYRFRRTAVTGKTRFKFN